MDRQPQLTLNLSLVSKSIICQVQNRKYHVFPRLTGGGFVGGISVKYHQLGDMLLNSVHSGAALRVVVNVGYMKYTRQKTWNPF